MPKKSIIVSPRERFCALPVRLRSLFAAIGPEVPVAVVEGATPDPIRAELKDLARARPFKQVALDRDRIPSGWTAAHRSKGVSSVYPWKRKILGGERFRSMVVEPLERRILECELAARGPLTASRPHPVAEARRRELLDSLTLSAPVAG